MRVLIALGGNAMTGPGGSATPADQDRAIGVAMQHVADLVADGIDVVLTHGNGPQVGNLLVKNELAAHVVPPGAARLVRRADPGHHRLPHPRRAGQGARRTAASTAVRRPW